ncbi:MAG: pyridoxamine 5'-phosphate oxidase family protein [Syntrophorhabdaceae bacterium]|nr:pyridoxamine 5'-phosphate oxidase family protein [Syntrophorhabdaceae bacterium]
MKLSEYFENTLGRGVLATADAKGSVDAAVYSRPHFVDEETAVWIMTDRLTHANLQSNPHAAYIFAEAAGNTFVGKRLYLTKMREESDPVKIEQFRWRKTYKVPEEQKNEKRFVVYFHVDKVLPLVGDKP